MLEEALVQGQRDGYRANEAEVTGDELMEG